MLTTPITNSDGRPDRQQAAQRNAVRNQQRSGNTRGQTENAPAPDTFRMSMGDEDEDDHRESYREAFLKREVRHQFIKCVYAILCVQLACTASVVCFFKYYEPAGMWLFSFGYWFWILIGIATMILAFALICCESVRKTFPLNMLMLALFTLLQGLMMALLCMMSSTNAVLLALGCTCAICVGLTIFACQTKCDFTVCWGFGICALIILLVMGIACIFIKSKILHIVYSSIGVAVFSFYLVMDTQAIMGGRSKFQIAPDEYILGALQLYLDIILLFMYLLNLINLTE